MEKKKKWYTEAGVLTIIGGAGIACLLVSGDFNLLSYQAYREYHETITPMFLEVMGIALVAGLVVWLARRHSRLPPRFERSGWLCIWGLNGIVSAILSGTILSILASPPWRIWNVSGDVLQNGNKQSILALLDLTNLGFFLLATFFLVASGLFWRNFFESWRTPKAATGQ